MPDRYCDALRLRQRGATYSEIGFRLGVSKERAEQIVRKADEQHFGNTPEWFYKRERFNTKQISRKRTHPFG